MKNKKLNWYSISIALGLFSIFGIGLLMTLFFVSFAITDSLEMAGQRSIWTELLDGFRIICLYSIVILPPISGILGVQTSILEFYYAQKKRIAGIVLSSISTVFSGGILLYNLIDPPIKDAFLS